MFGDDIIGRNQVNSAASIQLAGNNPITSGPMVHISYPRYDSLGDISSAKNCSSLIEDLHNIPIFNAPFLELPAGFIQRGSYR